MTTLISIRDLETIEYSRDKYVIVSIFFEKENKNDVFV